MGGQGVFPALRFPFPLLMFSCSILCIALRALFILNIWSRAGRRHAPRKCSPRVRLAAPARSNRAGAGLRRGLRRAEDGAGARDPGHARPRTRAGLGAVRARRACREGRRRGGGREGGERSGTCNHSGRGIDSRD